MFSRCSYCNSRNHSSSNCPSFIADALPFSEILDCSNCRGNHRIDFCDAPDSQQQDICPYCNSPEHSIIDCPAYDTDAAANSTRFAEGESIDGHLHWLAAPDRPLLDPETEYHWDAVRALITANAN